MPIPNKIKLKDVVYQVGLNPYLVYYGMCEVDDKYIQVNPEYHKSKDALYLTLIHEIIHGLFKEHGIKAKSEEIEEAFVREVEKNIKRFLKLKGNI